MIRREFFGLAAAGCLTTSLKADPLGLPVGCQVYPVRESLGKDFEGTLRQIASAGFKSIEMCSPPGYGAAFAPLAKMSASDMRRAINAAGLRCESSHYTRRELNENLAERIAFAKELGLKQMIMSSFAVRKDATMADWTRAAGELNKIGEQMQKAGIQAGFHNHNVELTEIGGAVIYDELMKTLDPKLVKMQFQVAVISLGVDPTAVLTKYPGRFISLHLMDWSPADKKPMPVGKGSIDWKKLFAAAKRGGVKNYFVEMDMDAMKASVPYLRDLKT